MKRYLLYITCIITIQSAESIANIRDPHEGGICHVEAEYFYPGVWEKYGEKELICNYWKFLGEEDRQILESQLFSEDEFDVEYGDYNSIEEMDGE
ncbi:TPA: hypothetical protein ACVBP7_001995 [Haemophilus influenzae]|jgi:hypothetical protein|nr:MULTISPECIES: hypothetical protein [Haemophilus]PRK87283.1 hypothetical protein BV145_00590 [Haemophilus influenzae]PRK87461.1 hypothetical protein BV144_01879 [Haemophilus influenzae]PRL95950.1 hypothetical protein BV016_00686 [Haemophilus influenzae]QOR09094.1 hypothetical protein INP98_05255 [Haemophilus parainfluenzae]QOR12616.1 hypothetical protein INP97_05150 [Haemophilus parainfluenzae]